jgi:hypothetical protein
VRSRTKTGNSSGLVSAATEAVVELGHAAERFQESLRHVSKARRKGNPVTDRAKRAGSKAIAAGKRAYRSARQIIRSA